MAVLDSATLIDLSRRPGSPIRRRAWEAVRARLTAGESLATTRFNVAELYVGAEMSNDPAGEARKIRLVLRWCAVLEFDDRAALAYAKLFARLRAGGRLPADMDLLIGSVALANGHSLVTRNVRHFDGLPGLIVHTY